jgi:PST family polysaccharide transporter
MVKWGTQILSWFSTIFVARLLTRADYGIAGMAFVYIGFVQLINELGISAAVVQRRDLTTTQIARLGGLSAILGAAFCLASIALARPVAAFFGEPAVTQVIAVLSLTFLISGFQVLPRAVLTRDMEFRKLASVEGIEAVSQTVVTLALAIAGVGYWAIIAGMVAGRSVSTVVLLIRHHHPIAWPRDFKSIAGPVTFGSHLVIGNVAWYAFRNADSALIGRLLGKAALGAYSVGGNLASIPVDRVTALVSRVTPAIFASVQNKPVELRRYLFGLTEALALVTFPLAVGMALVVEEGVLVMLGEEWRPAIVPLRLLALAAAYRSIVPLLNQVLVATGHARTTMIATVISAIVLPPLFYFGTFGGPGGVAWIWLAAFPLVSLATLARPALRVCGMPVLTYLRATWPAVSSVGVMTAAVLGVAEIIPDSWPLASRLAAKVITGGVAYAAVIFALYRDRIQGFIAILRTSRRSNPAEAA